MVVLNCTADRFFGCLGIHVAEIPVERVHHVVDRGRLGSGPKAQGFLEGNGSAGRVWHFRQDRVGTTREQKEDQKMVKDGWSLTIEGGAGARDLLLSVLRILRLPDSPDVIELSVVEVKCRVSRAGKRIIGEPADGEVTGGVENGLRDATGELPAIGTFLQALDVGAAEEELNIARLGLFAPERVEVAGQASWVVVKSRAGRLAVSVVDGDGER